MQSSRVACPLPGKGKRKGGDLLRQHDPPADAAHFKQTHKLFAAAVQAAGAQAGGTVDCGCQGEQEQHLLFQLAANELRCRHHASDFRSEPGLAPPSGWQPARGM
eukprot:1153434-Pelagomonas_calceolata.AAC.3